MILIIDLGTTGVRCIAYSDQWDQVASHYREISHSAPEPGQFVQNLEEILEKTIDVLNLAWRDAGSPKKVVLGLTNQRESLAVWNRKTGVPLFPSLNWQDTRYGKVLEAMLQNGLEPQVHALTGLRLFPYFTAGKMSWILENMPEIRESSRTGEIAMGTLDSWLVWSLTGGPHGGRFVTDSSNASRTCLMDLHQLGWSKELMSWFNIPEEVLPQIVPSGDPEAFGAVKHPKLPFEAQIVAVLGDQQSALLGQSCIQQGLAKNTYGTASAILISTGNETKTESFDLLSTLFFQLKGERANYALEGSTGATGGVIAWLKDQMGLFSSLEEASLLASSVTDSAGVHFIPALSGLYAPYWDLRVRGSIEGLTMHTQKGHVVRAAFEAIAFQTLDVLNAARAQAGVSISELRVDGGATNNKFLMQLQADILGIPILQLEETDVTARGTAYLAGLVLGTIKMNDLPLLYQVKRIYEPTWSEDRREIAYTSWKKEIERTRYQA